MWAGHRRELVPGKHTCPLVTSPVHETRGHGENSETSAPPGT